jgi:excisionase family DNA binding protein
MQTLDWRRDILGPSFARGLNSASPWVGAFWERTMADCILIPLQNLGVLALSREAFDAAIAAGSRLIGFSATPLEVPEALLDAEQAAERLGVSNRWLEDSARAGIVPHYKLGRYIRFRVTEVAGHCRVTGPNQLDNDLSSRGVRVR